MREINLERILKLARITNPATWIFNPRLFNNNEENKENIHRKRVRRSVHSLYMQTFSLISIEARNCYIVFCIV